MAMAASWHCEATFEMQNTEPTPAMVSFDKANSEQQIPSGLDSTPLDSIDKTSNAGQSCHTHNTRAELSPVLSTVC